jgi:hypothetical protein
MTLDQSCSRAGIRKLGSLRRNPAFRLSVQFSRRTALGRTLPVVTIAFAVQVECEPMVSMNAIEWSVVVQIGGQVRCHYAPCAYARYAPKQADKGCRSDPPGPVANTPATLQAG